MKDSCGRTKGKDGENDAKKIFDRKMKIKKSGDHWTSPNSGLDSEMINSSSNNYNKSPFILRSMKAIFWL